jgi:IS5 family transposase
MVGELPEQMSAHLDRGYDSKTTREKLQDRGLLAEIVIIVRRLIR